MTGMSRGTLPSSPCGGVSPDLAPGPQVKSGLAERAYRSVSIRLSWSTIPIGRRISSQAGWLPAAENQPPSYCLIDSHTSTVSPEALIP